MIPYRLLTETPKTPTDVKPMSERLVHRGHMPPFLSPPKVVVWGARTFAYAGQDPENDHLLDYTEVFAWNAVPYPPAAPQAG